MIETNAIRNRRFNLGDILEQSWAVFMANLPALLVIVLIFFVPLSIPGAWFGAKVEAFRQANEGAEVPFGLLGVTMLLGLAFALISLVVTMGVYYLTDRSLAGSSVSWTEAIGKGFSKITSGITTSLLAFVILLGLTLLLIVPGIIWGVYYSFILCAVALRDQSNKSALAYSKSLVKGNWWRVFGVLLVVGILVAIAGSVPALLMGLVTGAVAAMSGAAEVSTNSPLVLIFGVISGAIQNFVQMFMIIATAVFFLNLDYQKNSGAQGTTVV